MMSPAFQTKSAAFGFGIVLLGSLGLPVLLNVFGNSSREQTFDSLPNATGQVASVSSLLYKDSARADVLLLGSSLLKDGVRPQILSSALTTLIGTPTRVQAIEMNWYGADQEYFFLEDYLNHHPAPKLVLVHLPQLHATSNAPHPQSYRWIRFGEVPEFPGAFSTVGKFQLYGEMVLGGPRQLLTKLRSERLDKAEDGTAPDMSGGYSFNSVGVSDLALLNESRQVPMAHLLPASSPTFTVEKPRLGGSYKFKISQYTLFFLKKVADLVKSHGSAMALIHIPLGKDTDHDGNSIPELYEWTKIFGPNIKEIAITKSELYHGLTSSDFYNPGDNHMNTNGGRRFSLCIAPRVAELLKKGITDDPFESIRPNLGVR